tara:strand:- start:23 stop:397 length:375 start_codon:yes stop_codon:yes gene_type:complete
MTNKEIKQLLELDAKARASERLTGEEVRLRNELEFKRNKQNISIRLSGYDKYYYAHQCWDFTQYILENGFGRYKPTDIANVSFRKHSITVRFVSSAELDIKRFETSKEMLNFVIGWNACLSEVA